MAGRPSISKEELVGAALDLIRESGWEGVSARNLASRTAMSTMPIYSAMGSMDELKKACFLAVAALLDASQHRKRSDNPALDLALGYVAFARDEPRLYRFLLSAPWDMEKVIKEEAARPDYEKGGRAEGFLRQVFGEMPEPGQRDNFVFRTWIFTHGLADLVSSGRVDMDEAEIAGHLSAAGAAFYLQGKNMPDPAP